MNKIEPRKRQREKSAGGKTWYKPTSRARGAGQTPLEFAEKLPTSCGCQRNHHPPTRPALFRIPARARKSDTTQKKNSATIKRIQTEFNQKSSSLPRKTSDSNFSQTFALPVSSERLASDDGHLVSCPAATGGPGAYPAVRAVFLPEARLHAGLQKKSTNNTKNLRL